MSGGEDAEGSALCLISPRGKKRELAIDRLVNSKEGMRSANFSHQESRNPDLFDLSKRFGERKHRA